MPYKIALLVHGRFHGFDLARELLERGHDVYLFTNYPRRVAERFGIPRRRTQTFLSQGIASRVLWRLFPRGRDGAIEKRMNEAFGRWAARRVSREAWDVVIGFSGICKETFRALRDTDTLKVLQRGSAHIRVQREILEEEERRLGTWIQKPSDWIMDREEWEYAHADMIHVLSTFAYNSFIGQGVWREKLFHLRLGANTRAFRAPAEVIEERCRRIMTGAPLRVLNVGTFSLQKGMMDMAAAMGELKTSRYQFRFVGPVAADARELQAKTSAFAEFIGKRPQAELPEHYRWGDVFVLPTIQDGFAVVLCQALAGGLPLITSPHCGGPDLIEEGETGWVVPIRSPAALAERLRWCDAHRHELAVMVRRVAEAGQRWDWAETGVQAEQNIRHAMARSRASRSEKIQS